MNKNSIKNIIYVMAFMAMNIVFGTQAVSAVSAESGLAESASENTIAQEELTAEGASILYSGKSGDLDWSIDEDGLLTISGVGDYEHDGNAADGCSTPKWCDCSESIKSAKVNVSGITNTVGMFHGCEELTFIDVSGFDTGNVTNMGGDV